MVSVPLLMCLPLKQQVILCNVSGVAVSGRRIVEGPGPLAISMSHSPSPRVASNMDAYISHPKGLRTLGSEAFCGAS